MAHIIDSEAAAVHWLFDICNGQSSLGLLSNDGEVEDLMLFMPKMIKAGFHCMWLLSKQIIVIIIAVCWK